MPLRHFLLALLLCLGSLMSLPVRAGVVDIGNAELIRLQAEGVALVDIRTLPEWEDTGIVAGSHLITLFDERGQSRPADWLAQVGKVAAPGQPVIVICRSGNRTRAASQLLLQQGYGTVYNVREGIKGWLRAAQPVVPAAAAIRSCRARHSC